LMGWRDWRHSPINDVTAMSWVPNGRGLIIALNQSVTRCQLFSIKADGSDLRKWGPNGLCPVPATLGPDGVALTTGENHDRWQVRIFDADGHQREVIRFGSGQAGDVAAWRP